MTALFRPLSRALALFLIPFALAAEPFITVASTTSTRDSGLFDHLLPPFQAATGIAVRVVAVGTGQAIKLAERGDADVLFVHDLASEEKFVAEGFGVQRFAVMYNDFVLIGDKDDPAAVAVAPDAKTAFQRIAATASLFTSRGDDSGTHKAELRLWTAAGVNPRGLSWYRETGSGMGAMLNTAAGLGAYGLADRGTWASFKNRGPLALLLAGDSALFNPYGVILVSPAKHPHVKAMEGQRFIDWLVGPDGQAAIAAFRVNGEPLFFPQAQP